MSTDERDVLEVLRAELDFIEKGGYGRSVKTPWKTTSIFQDSLSCFGFPNHLHDDVCVLMELVPPERRGEDVPCHHIPLNAVGETIDQLEWKENQAELEETIKNWLRAAIKRLEEPVSSR